MAFREFLEEHVAKLQPLESRAARAWWEAATTGSAEAYRREARLREELERLFADRSSFERLRGLREAGEVRDPIERRVLELLYLAHLGRQCSPELLSEIVHRSSEVEHRFATFRAEVDGNRLSRNDVEQDLATSGDADRRRRVWQASKQVGPLVAGGVRNLARLRNRAARELGFDDHYRMALTLEELDPSWLAGLFDDLERRTREPFDRVKRGLDDELAEEFGIAPGDLRPWHYPDPFGQEPPDAPDLSRVDDFADRDIIGMAAAFFGGIGFDVEGILERSDVAERDGKNPHAFCIHIDREGDVRALLNVRPTARWMSAVLHELGHGVYDLGIRRDLPYTLRQPAHTFMTEGVAMLFGRMPYTASWRGRMGMVGDRERFSMERSLNRHQTRRQLLFARWSQVMVRFERALYEDPEADLQNLWWTLVERYQGIRRPEGRSGEDWATKTHIVSSPVYYHNYALGELFASQLLRALLESIGVRGGDEGDLAGRSATAPFLTERVFAPGASSGWPQHVQSATGRALSVDDFARQYSIA